MDFFWVFATVLLFLNLAGYLPLLFWQKIIFSAFGLILGLRAVPARTAVANMAAEIFFLGFVVAYGMLAVSLPLAVCLPANPVEAAAMLN